MTFVQQLQILFHVVILSKVKFFQVSGVLDLYDVGSGEWLVRHQIFPVARPDV